MTLFQNDQLSGCANLFRTELVEVYTARNAAPVIIQTTLSFSTAILSEATLSFLGLGTQPPDPSWGTMLGSGRKFMELAPWVAVYPGLAIALAVLGLNLLGDALRDALDPRLRRGRT